MTPVGSALLAKLVRQAKVGDEVHVEFDVASVRTQADDEGTVLFPASHVVRSGHVTAKLRDTFTRVWQIHCVDAEGAPFVVYEWNGPEYTELRIGG